jgi:outer membrane protein assembly factor BamB
MAQSIESDFLNTSASVAGSAQPPVNPADLVFVGFNKRVCALNRDTGELAWSWKAPEGSGYVVLLYDSDRLIASVQGYTYCLDPATGEQMWSNPLKGMGLGVPCLASISGVSSTGVQAMAEIEAAQHQSAS